MAKIEPLNVNVHLRPELSKETKEYLAALVREEVARLIKTSPLSPEKLNLEFDLSVPISKIGVRTKEEGERIMKHRARLKTKP